MVVGVPVVPQLAAAAGRENGTWVTRARTSAAVSVRISVERQLTAERSSRRASFRVKW